MTGKSALAFTVLILVLTAGCATTPADRPPNVVIIFTDDQGYADLGCTGAEGYTTPHLDRLASEGMRFTSFYVSEAVCSASRASLLTGCYAQRVGVRGAYGPWSAVGIHSDEVTLAELLEAEGYATAIVGKWHLGHHRKFLPLQHGFDEYLGLPYSNDMWPVNYDGTPCVKGAKRSYPDLPLIEGNERIESIRNLDDQATLTARYTARAVEFIERNRARPFFLYLPHSMVHVPLAVSERFRGRSEQGMYGDVMMEIDGSVGQILSALEEFDLCDDTLVIFVSDNGPWLNFGNHAGSAGPLREGKGTAFEGGVRVPCIMRWPGQIPAGTTCDRLAATIDLLPTLAEIVGAALPEQTIDGVSIRSLLGGHPEANPRETFLYYYGGELRAVRSGRYKLLLRHRSRSYEGLEPGRDGLPGPTASIDLGPELYDLESDPGETTDLSATRPAVMSRLTALVEQARRELGDRITGIEGAGVRPPGRVAVDRRPPLRHKALAAHLELGTAFSPSYTGGGHDALIDGVRASLDFQDGKWQGYEATDLMATITLDRPRRVSRITCSFLSNQVSWIFLPTAVDFTVTQPGGQEKTHRIDLGEPVDGVRPHIKDLEFEPPPGKAAKITVQAIGIAQCPKWHGGAGGKAWLFVDEIVVR